MASSGQGRRSDWKDRHMQVQNILVSLDGSERAAAVLPHVRAFAATFQARVRLLGVVEHGVERGTQQQQLTAWAQRLQGWGIEAATQQRSGEPADVIVSTAEELQVDLLALTTRGRGGLQRLLLGSVADAILKRSTRPMLVVTPPSSGEHGAEIDLHRILLPLDGSSLAERALPLAALVASRFRAELNLVRVRGYGSVWPQGSVLEHEESAEQELALEAQAYLEQAQRGLPSGISSELVVLRGDPRTALVEFVERDHSDLVVMTTRGQSGLRRLVIGSVADAVVRSGVPTLLLPPTA
jgi:nucleotide-binding universal stress UspA family protein